jgi:tRNA (guanine-N7-)-methyltransferase
LQCLPEHYLPGSNELTSLTNNHEKVILEIGFGNGDNTTFLASQNPNALIIAAEVYLSGIGSLLASISEHSFTNIKIFDKDVRELLLQVDQEIFDEVYIICPDPWPKVRHHKRRLVQHEFLKLLAKVLKKNGTVYISTDWDNYAESMQEEIERTKDDFEFKKISNEGMPVTRFQKRAMNEGRSISTFLLKVLKK